MDLVTLETRQNKLLLDAKTMLDLAQKESRGLNDDETKKHDELLKDLEAVGKSIGKVKGDRDFIAQLDSLTQGAVEGAVDRRLSKKSLGQEFIESAVGKYLSETKSSRAVAWRSPSVELKATLLESPLVEPQYLPTIVPSPQRPIVMSSLFPIGPTSSNAIVFLEETTFTNTAAPTAEAGTKPESALVFTSKTVKVEKVAHWLPVSDELLEDEPGIKAYIDGRLKLGVMLALDNQLLNGTGVSPQLPGFLTRADLTAALPIGTMTAPDAIATQIGLVEQAGQMAVDGIVANPSDWLKMSMVKATDGTYIAQNPFVSPTGLSLWGRTVSLTTAMPQGKVLVGAFRTGGAQLFQRGGLRVEASQSHQDFWIRDLTAIRAEIRIAIVVVRPTAFGLVTGLPATFEA